MEKSNISLIVTFLIISAVSSLHGMKRKAVNPGDGVPAEKTQAQDPAKQVSKKLVGLINNGDGCFVNSAIQILYNIPEFHKFLETHIKYYVTDELNASFSIPYQFIKVFKAMQQSKVASCGDAVNFRKFVCSNSLNPDLRVMLLGQHDSGEFLKLVLEHFQYYTKYHLDLLNVLVSLIPSDDSAVRDLLKKEIIDLVLLDISDFRNIDRISFDYFAQCVKRSVDEFRLKISKVKLKEAFQHRDLNNFAQYALSTEKLINDLGRQESEEFFGKISAFIDAMNAFHEGVDAKDKAVRDVLDLFNQVSEHNLSNEIKLLTLQACFGENKDWGWLKDKIKYLELTGADTIYLRNDLVLNKHLDLILGGINSPESKERINFDLGNIQRNLSEFRRLFCARVNGNWQVCLNLVSPLAVDSQVLAEIAIPLESEAEYKKDSRPRLKLEDLLNLFTQFDVVADMPEILIVQPKSCTDEDCTLPEIKKVDEKTLKTFGFESFSGKSLRRGMKFPLVYMPGRSVNIRNQPYELIGIIYHKGDLVSGGHFIAACKNGSSWKIFNDSRVSAFDCSYIADGGFTVHVAIYHKVQNASSLPTVMENVSTGSDIKQ